MNILDLNDPTLVERMRLHRQQGLADMAAGMAHEINQPLSGIRGFAEGLLIGLEDGWDISKQEIIEKMRRIIFESDRIDNLIQGIRGFTDENARLDLLSIELFQVTQAAVRLWQARLRSRGIELTVACADPTATWVRGNPFAVQEVVQILLANAGDACLAMGGTEGRVSIIVDGGRSVDEPATITVSDNGIGMNEMTLARAGEPFFTTKEPGRGVGLGLAIAKGLLAQCGGQLDLRSTEKQGTTAQMRLWHRLVIKEPHS